MVQNKKYDSIIKDEYEMFEGLLCSIFVAYSSEN